MYCNLDNLQRDYKKYGCRLFDPNENFWTFKERHREISHWYKYFFESIYFYGSKTKEKDKFYFGLNIELLFNTFTPRFECPFSTSVDINIATEFSKGNGVILKLIPSSIGKDRYFDVEWLSNFERERERVFFFARDLRIFDVFTFSNQMRVSNRAWIRSFTLFSSIFNGHFYVSNLLKRQQEKTQKMLVQLIKNYNNFNNIKNEDDNKDDKDTSD